MGLYYLYHTQRDVKTSAWPASLVVKSMNFMFRHGVDEDDVGYDKSPYKGKTKYRG